MAIPRHSWMAFTAILFLCSGCAHWNKVIEEVDQRPGNYETIEQLLEASQKIMIGGTKCTEEELKRLGFDPAMKNATAYPGAQGLEFIVGTKSLQSSNGDTRKALHDTEDELGEHLVFIYPFRWFAKIEEAVWFYTKHVRTRGPITLSEADMAKPESERPKGTDGKLIVVCRRDDMQLAPVVVFRDWQGERNIDRLEVKKEPGGNVWAVIAGVVAAGAFIGTK